MKIYECQPMPHYSQREKGKCAICGHDLVERELIPSKYKQTRWRWLFGEK